MNINVNISEDLLSVILGIYPEVRLLYQEIILFLSFEEPLYYFLWLYFFTLPPAMQSVLISPYSHQCLLVFAFVFFVIAILVDVQVISL